MARQRHLLRAPITEALIDLQVKRRQELSFEELERAVSAAPDAGYYVKNPISEGRFGLKLAMGQGQPAQLIDQTAGKIGLRLHSRDERYVAQYRLSGFTLSRLPPYEEWAALLKETRRMWEIYFDIVRPIEVTRIATRYINNLQLPLGRDLFQKYVNKFVDVPDGMPQGVEAFSQRFRLVDLEANARVIITLALDRPVAEGQPVPVTLDIDAFRHVNFDLRNPAIWETLESLRALKNRCFFGTITEAAADLYQ